MTRIIAGIAGSRQLVGPAVPTRPTSDRIRESIFNRLDNWDALDGASVLDLYAGTGALALEAVSRGAKLAMMVERDSKAAVVCIKNAERVQEALLDAGIEADTLVACKSVDNYLATTPSQSFDVVFIDPPYEVSNEEVATNLVHLLPWLNEDALIVLERSSRSGAVDLPTEYQLDDTKSYGDTTVYWLSIA